MQTPDRPRVLDASSMLALTKNEPGADQVIDALTTPRERCHAHPVNLCEVYYATAREDGEEDAEAMLHFLLETAGVLPYVDNDMAFLCEAGRLRAFATSQRLAISLADCFCIATARALGADVLTCDHREFDPIIPLGLCPVTFIR
jgi:PIN domain nuclease of toxin-antitoxin system